MLPFGNADWINKTALPNHDTPIAKNKLCYNNTRLIVYPVEITMNFLEVLPTLLQENPDRAQLPLEDKLIVFAADTDRTQSYVFESDRLPQIRGGSRLLSDLNDPEALHQILDALNLPYECLLYAGGGGVLAILPNLESAQTLGAELQRAYIDKTGVATITTVQRTFRIGELLDGGGAAQSAEALSALPASDQARARHYLESTRKRFGEIVTLMGMLLRRAKAQRLPPPYYEVMPFATLCPDCQTRPALSGKRLTAGDDSRLVCGPCFAKHEYGRGPERRHWINELAADLRSAQYPTDAGYPEDLEMLSGGEDIALVYADGDGIGEALKNLPTPHAYRQFSLALADIMRRAVAQSIATVPALKPLQIRNGSDNFREVYPWEVITIGGDDVLILMQAKAALPFAVALAKHFADLTKKQGYDIRMSVGYAEGKASQPIRVLQSAAKAALKSAKRRARDENKGKKPHEKVACIDFHNFVKEGMPVTPLHDVPARRSRTKLLLTGRPYTVAEAAALLRSVEILRNVKVKDDETPPYDQRETRKKFPKGQLYSLIAELRAGDARGVLFYHYQRARMKAVYREALDEVARQWSGEGISTFPWLRRGGSVPETFMVLQDMADLYAAQDRSSDD